jgi:hypothetical protein
MAFNQALALSNNKQEKIVESLKKIQPATQKKKGKSPRPQK